MSKTREAFRGRGLVEIDGETTADELIYMRSLMISAMGGKHERQVVQMADEIGMFGGLLEIAIFFGTFVYSATYGPFRDLDLAISFSQLKNQICHQEKLLPSAKDLD